MTHELATRRVGAYYFYILDPDFGLAFIKICTYGPWFSRVWVNGHEWAKRQAAKAGIRFTALSNGFASCDQPERLQAVCDSFGPGHVQGFFDRWIAQIPTPLSDEDRHAGYWWELSMRQVETSRTLVFDDPRRARSFFEALVADNIGIGRPEEVSMVFARQLRRPTQHRYQTRIFTTGTEIRITSANKAVNASISSSFQQAEVTSLPITLVILVLAFGALVAAGVPLLLGFTAVAAALGLTELFSHVLHVYSGISSVILCIGLAVGIDYSLFYLRRVREERAGGRTPAAALQVAAATSGRAVLISGLTVMIAMTGMFLMGNQIFTSFAIGTVLVVAIALVGSLTVLPAVLARLGDRVDRGRVPGLSRLRTSDGESRFWAKIVGVVLRRPLLWGGLAAALLIALAIPAFSLHTVNSGFQGAPRNLPIMKVYDRIQAEFPGGAVPETVVISAPDVTSPRVTTGIVALERAALATGRCMSRSASTSAHRTKRPASRSRSPATAPTPPRSKRSGCSATASSQRPSATYPESPRTPSARQGARWTSPTR